MKLSIQLCHSFNSSIIITVDFGIGTLALSSPQALEVPHDNLEAKGMNASFWLYLIGASLIAAGYADFPLIAYHFQKTAVLSPIWIPVFYAIAMGVNMISAPLLGRFYDRKGFVF